MKNEHSQKTWQTRESLVLWLWRLGIFYPSNFPPRCCDGLITGAASCFEKHNTDFSMQAKEVRMWCLAWGHSLQSCPFIAWTHIPRFTGQKVSEENIPIITDTGLAFCYFFPSLQALAKTAGHPKSTWKASAAAQQGFPRFIFLLYGTSKGAFDQSPTYWTPFGDPLKNLSYQIQHTSLH